MSNNVWAVIPVYNNASTVKAVAVGCRAELPHVVVVDDGSADTDVSALFKGTDIIVLRHAANEGKGRALLTGLRYVREQGGEFMITVDADGQHHPADIRKFLPILAEPPPAIVIGARRMDAPNVPASSRFGMKFSDFWVRLETGQAVKDTQSGFRAYPVPYVSQLAFDSRRYDFEVEVLARAAWAGLTVKSVDVDVTYPEKGKRISHFRPFLDNLRLTHRHVLLVCRRLWPWPHRRLVQKESDEVNLFLRHPVRFFRTLVMEHATPGELGMAAAVGVFLATLPLVSLHTVAIIYVATRLKLNRVMAVAIQNLCMPPVVPFVCVELGYFMRHGGWLRDMTWETWGHQAPQRLWEWLLGSLIAAPILAVVTGVSVWCVVAMVKRRRVVVLILAGLLWVGGAGEGMAEETNGVPDLPKWEAGMIGMGARIPYYRGADQYRWYAFPVPYFIYRGDYLKADKEGVRGVFFKGKWIETELSMSGNPPVRDGSGARGGMPELDPLVELGPAVRLFLYRGEKVSALYLEAAVRAVNSIDMDTFNPEYEGARSSMSLVVARFTPRAGSPWNAGLRTGVDFADRNYHRYFYDVDEAYVIPDRPAYESRGGYSGCSVSGWITRKLFDGVSLAIYAKLDNCEGAVYEDSPLVRSKDNVTVGAALSWKIAESKTRVTGK